MPACMRRTCVYTCLGGMCFPLPGLYLGVGSRWAWFLVPPALGAGCSLPETPTPPPCLPPLPPGWPTPTLESPLRLASCRRAEGWLLAPSGASQGRPHRVAPDLESRMHRSSWRTGLSPSPSSPRLTAGHVAVAPFGVGELCGQMTRASADQPGLARLEKASGQRCGWREGRGRHERPGAGVQPELSPRGSP